MEALSCLIAKAVDGGFLCGRRFGGRGREGMIISHLLYADHTILFCELRRDQMAYLSWLLMWFKAISGLKINLNKSKIIPVGSVENVEVLALELGCKIGSLPSSYLGLPLGAKHNSMAVWDAIEERFRKRLLFGRGNTYLMEGDSLSFAAISLVYLFITCLYFVCLGESR